MRTLLAACAGTPFTCIALLLLTTFTVATPAPAAAAVTWTVTSLDDSSSTPPDGSLRKILSSAASGDTIVFDSGLAQAGGTATITLAETLDIQKNITIQGPTDYTLVITTNRIRRPLLAIYDDDNSPPVANPSRDNLDNASKYWLTVTLKNLVMQNSSGDAGGAIMAFLAEVSCVDCTFANSYAYDSGAAVFTQLCFLHFTNCSFTNNHADYTGDVMYAGACDLDFTGCTFSGNGGSEAGGTIFAEFCHFQLTGCAFSGNYALFSGGAVYSADSDLTVASCSFSGNAVAFTDNESGNDRLIDDSPSDIFTDGGAITLTGGTLTISNSTFSNNTCVNTNSHTGAYSCGGALSVVGTLTADSCIFEQNSCSSKHFTAFGGVLSQENDASDSLTLKNCSFNSNSVLSSFACGGAIDCNAIASQTIENCSFISNTSQVNGGALHLRSTSSLSCTNSTFYNNSAAYGSVLHAAADAIVNTLQFLFATIVDNTTSNGSAISLENATASSVSLTNTLLTNTNASGADIAAPGGTTVSLSGGNFIGSISGGYTDAYAATDYASLLGVTSTSLVLSPLRIQYDTTAKLQVLIPLDNSPARDAAIPSSVTTDERGMSRPQLGEWDSGAIEAVRKDWIAVCFNQSWLLISFALLLLGGKWLLARNK